MSLEALTVRHKEIEGNLTQLQNQYHMVLGQKLEIERQIAELNKVADEPQPEV